MTEEQVLEVSDKYLDFIKKNKYVAKKHSELECPKSDEAIEHSAWMLEQIPWFIKEGKIAKAMRWLCFVQGILWREGFTTIEEMKNDNRESPP
jgi:hypothetical protein